MLLQLISLQILNHLTIIHNRTVDRADISYDVIREKRHDPNHAASRKHYDPVLLKPVSPLLQRVQETHEELMAGEGVWLVADDAVERSNSIRITEPNRISVLFHSDSFLFNRPDSIG